MQCKSGQTQSRAEFGPDERVIPRITIDEQEQGIGQLLLDVCLICHAD
jgi:hypothetical protein